MTRGRLRLLLLSSTLWLIGGCVLVSGNFSLFPSTPEPLEEQIVAGKTGDKILLLDISEVIDSRDERGGFATPARESTTARVAAELTKAEQDEQVKAIVLRINSPGGTVTASDVIYEQLSRFRRQQARPIVAHFLDVAASGGYYVSLAADEIIASPTTVTGSIGVVMHGLNVEGLMNLVGIKEQTIKSGDKKDIGSPLRPMEPAERQILQSMVDDMKSRFVDLVRERRTGMSPESLTTLSDGRIVSAPQALSFGLVDRIGYLPDAIERARQRASLGEVRVVQYRRRNEYSETIYSASRAQPLQMNLLQLGGESPLLGPNLYYLWSPRLD